MLFVVALKRSMMTINLSWLRLWRIVWQRLLAYGFVTHIPQLLFQKHGNLPVAKAGRTL